MRLRGLAVILIGSLSTACPFGGGGDGGAVTVGEDDADDDAAEPGPAPTSTPRRRAAQVMPQGFVINVLSGTQIDFGAKGNLHGVALPDGTQWSMDTVCADGANGETNCAIYGPRDNKTMIPGAPSNQRCVDANNLLTGLECDTDSDCSNGTCQVFVAAPLHINRGGDDARCVIAQFTNSPALVGSWDPIETTLGLDPISIQYKTYNRFTHVEACPTCRVASGDETPTCSWGARRDQPCTVFGSNRVDMDATSLDCPPAPEEHLPEASGSFVIPAMSGSPADSYVEWVVGDTLIDLGGRHSLCGVCLNGMGCRSDEDCPGSRAGRCFADDGDLWADVGASACVGSCEAVDEFEGVCQGSGQPCFNSASNGTLGSSLRARNGFRSSSDAWLGTPLCIGNPDTTDELKSIGLPGPGRIQLHFGTTTLTTGSGLPTDHPLNISFENGAGGSGRIASETGGINCSTNCTHNFNVGTELTLTPIPAEGSWFAGWRSWGDDDCEDGNIRMARAVSCVAAFGSRLEWDEAALSLTDRQDRSVTAPVQLSSTGTNAEFTLVSSAPWLTYSHLGDTTPKSVTIRADASGLAVGTYIATLTASATEYYEADVLTVTFTVTP